MKKNIIKMNMSALMFIAHSLQSSAQLLSPYAQEKTPQKNTSPYEHLKQTIEQAVLEQSFQHQSEQFACLDSHSRELVENYLNICKTLKTLNPDQFIQEGALTSYGKYLDAKRYLKEKLQYLKTRIEQNSTASECLSQRENSNSTQLITQRQKIVRTHTNNFMKSHLPQQERNAAKIQESFSFPNEQGESIVFIPASLQNNINTEQLTAKIRNMVHSAINNND